MPHAPVAGDKRVVGAASETMANQVERKIVEDCSVVQEMIALQRRLLPGKFSITAR